METLEEKIRAKKIPKPYLNMARRRYFSEAGLRKGAAYTYKRVFPERDLPDELVWRSDTGDYIVPIFNGTYGQNLVYGFREDERGLRLRLTDECSVVVLNRPVKNGSTNNYHTYFYQAIEDERRRLGIPFKV